MILDSMLDFGSYTMSGSDGACADVVDTKAEGEALGNELYLVVKTGGTAPAGGTSVICKLQTCAASTFSSGVVDLITLPSIALADLPANKVLFRGRVPIGAMRYLRVFNDVTGTFTAGTIEAFLVQGPQAGWGEV